MLEDLMELTIFLMGIVQKIIGIFIILFNKKLVSEGSQNLRTESRSSMSQIPIIGLAMIVLGDIILIIFIFRLVS